MKYVLILLVAVSLLFGCSHLAGNDPEGVTGGHSGGYGSFGSSYNDYYYPDLMGSWQQNGQQSDYNVVTFQNNGTVKVDFHSGNQQHSAIGSYLVSGNRIDININGWLTGSHTISGDNGSLSLTNGNDTTILHKIG